MTMSYTGEMLPTLHTSDLASSRDASRQSVPDLNTLESENIILHRTVQLLFENQLFKSQLNSAYGARSTSPVQQTTSAEVPVLSDQAGPSSPISASSSQRYPDPSSRSINYQGNPSATASSKPTKHSSRIYDSCSSQRSPILSPRNTFGHGLASAISPSTPTTCSPQLNDRYELSRSCACLVGPILQRTEMFAFRPSTVGTGITPEDGAPTLYSSQLARSRDSLQQSLLDLNTILSENTVMRRNMELRQENQIFKDHISTEYGARSTSPILPSAPFEFPAFSAGIGLSSPIPAASSQRDPDPSPRSIYGPGQGLQSSIASANLGYTDQLSERSCCETGKSCACLVGPSLQRTERFAFRPTSTEDTRIKPDERYGGSVVTPPPKIVGEIAFQLENRILDYIFSHHNRENADVRKRRRYSGHTVKNITYLIKQEYTNSDGSINESIQFQLKDKLKYILVTLSQFGYSLEEHSSFADKIINEYGILTNAPDHKTMELFDIDDADILRGFITLLTRSVEDRKHMLILLECLLYLAKDSCKPVFLN